MAKRVIVKRTRTRVPEYTCLGCPLTKSRTQWCYRLCVPVNGRGTCGRIAPHSLLGRTQQAILRHRLRQTEATTQ